MLGAALALVVEILMLTAGQTSLTTDAGQLAGFFDAQGRALLHGRLRWTRRR